MPDVGANYLKKKSLTNRSNITDCSSILQSSLYIILFVFKDEKSPGYHRLI